ncbi:MAG: hypothetical protein AAF808_04310 [Cyanobacteria bacterium P01_D01_bin.2]
MGFAVRADRDRIRNAKGSRKQNLVLLHPTKTSQPARPPAAPAEVKHLSTARRLPLGLRLLVGVQQGSTVMTGGLIATALVIYSWTVYLDKTVARSFQYLESLKVSTQQVTTANETLKHSMAQQAESPAAGFKPFEPRRAIFVSPAPTRPSVEAPVEPGVHAPMPHPLGY